MRRERRGRGGFVSWAPRGGGRGSCGHFHRPTSGCQLRLFGHSVQRGAGPYGTRSTESQAARDPTRETPLPEVLHAEGRDSHGEGTESRGERSERCSKPAHDARSSLPRCREAVMLARRHYWAPRVRLEMASHRPAALRQGDGCERGDASRGAPLKLGERTRKKGVERRQILAQLDGQLLDGALLRHGRPGR